jgi:hypothetical protein
MNIPEPNEYAKDHGHNPFPPRWERWLSAVRQSILTSQPQAGRHVTIDEHPGKGTVINVERRPSSGGGCACPSAIASIDFAGISIRTDCISCGSSSGTIQWADLNVNQTATAWIPQGLVCDPPAGSCAWRSNTGDPSNPEVQYQVDCTGPSISENLSTVVALINCRWFVFATSFVCGISAPSNRGSVVFYGEADNLSVPIPNTVTFTEPITIDSDLMDHLFGDCTGAQTFVGIGDGGTATVTVTP